MNKVVGIKELLPCPNPALPIVSAQWDDRVKAATKKDVTDQIARATADSPSSTLTTLWRNRSTNELFHWKGRACKVYTKVDGRWLFLFQTGLLEY
jgi:hypothetical protein